MPRPARERVWQATFSGFGGTRAGRAGHGLLLSRTQPRPAGPPPAPHARSELQQPIIDAYLEALPDRVPPRITRLPHRVRRRLTATRRAAAPRRGLRRAAEGFPAPGSRRSATRSTSSSRRSTPTSAPPTRWSSRSHATPPPPRPPRSRSRCTRSIRRTTSCCARSSSSPPRSRPRSGWGAPARDRAFAAGRTPETAERTQARCAAPQPQSCPTITQRRNTMTDLIDRLAGVRPGGERSTPLRRRRPATRAQRPGEPRRPVHRRRRHACDPWPSARLVAAFVAALHRRRGGRRPLRGPARAEAGGDALAGAIAEPRRRRQRRRALRRVPGEAGSPARASTGRGYVTDDVAARRARRPARRRARARAPARLPPAGVVAARRSIALADAGLERPTASSRCRSSCRSSRSNSASPPGSACSPARRPHDRPHRPDHETDAATAAEGTEPARILTHPTHPYPPPSRGPRWAGCRGSSPPPRRRSPSATTTGSSTAGARERLLPAARARPRDPAGAHPRRQGHLLQRRRRAAPRRARARRRRDIRVNGCVFCASVHARFAAHHSKRHDDVRPPPRRGHRARLGAAWRRDHRRGRRPHRHPVAFDAAHVDALRAAGSTSWRSPTSCTPPLLQLGEPAHALARGAGGAGRRLMRAVSLRDPMCRGVTPCDIRWLRANVDRRRFVANAPEESE